MGAFGDGFGACVGGCAGVARVGGGMPQAEEQNVSRGACRGRHLSRRLSPAARNIVVELRQCEHHAAHALLARAALDFSCFEEVAAGPSKYLNLCNLFGYLTINFSQCILRTFSNIYASLKQEQMTQLIISQIITVTVSQKNIGVLSSVLTIQASKPAAGKSLSDWSRIGLAQWSVSGDRRREVILDSES